MTLHQYDGLTGRPVPMGTRHPGVLSIILLLIAFVLADRLFLFPLKDAVVLQSDSSPSSASSLNVTGRNRRH